MSARARGGTRGSRSTTHRPPKSGSSSTSSTREKRTSIAKPPLKRRCVSAGSTALFAAERALKAEPAAWRFFETLAPSYRRAYVGWIDSAKREETKQRRLREAVARLANGEKLGLK